jgi:hypothetical protein
MSHTPGPWNIGDENNQCCEVLLGTLHNLTANVDRQDSNTGQIVITRDEMLANARLMAAAPDLLEACKLLMEHIKEGLVSVYEERADNGQPGVSACEAIESAIAKATGGA